VLVQGQTATFSLRVTQKERFSNVLPTTQQLDVTSPEWIAEAPYDCGAFGRCRVSRLTDFGTVTFTRAAAIGNNHPASPIATDSSTHPEATSEVPAAVGAWCNEMDSRGVRKMGHVLAPLDASRTIHSRRRPHRR
jgi:hypothetical protein